MVIVYVFFRLKTLCLKSLGLKSPGMKLGVENSGVEMSWNLSKRRCWFEIHQKTRQWQIFPLLLFSLTNENWLLQFCPAMSMYLLKLETPEPGHISFFIIQLYNRNNKTCSHTKKPFGTWQFGNLAKLVFWSISSFKNWILQNY